MSDSINRQDAINAIIAQDGVVDKSAAKRILIQLPSAQTETCDGCKHKGKWENEVEYGHNSPCTMCKRSVNDNYER